MARNLQDFILNEVRKNNTRVTVHLINGSQIAGEVKSFDNYVIVLEVDGRVEMIYKHAISAIIPSKPLSGLNIGAQEEKR